MADKPATAVRMNALDRGIAVFAPRVAAQRMFARMVLATYEGGRSTKRRKKSRDNSTGERLVARDAATVRATVRDLERNHDLVDGALSTLTRNIVGPAGISIEPTPRVGTRGDNYDDIHDDFARDLLNAFREWSKAPEVTRTLDWVQAQELACRSWLRDGEFFAQLVEGNSAYIRHASKVPLSLELLESDVVPNEYNDEGRKILAGIERNEWGQPLAFWCWKQHPGTGAVFTSAELKRVPAERMLHVAVRRRLSGLRGISLFAPAIDRLLDIKDYEESERIAARIAARMAWYIKRDKDMTGWTPDANFSPQDDDRDFTLEAGAIFTETLPGEEIAMINANRPNSGLERFRMAMLRAASRCLGLSYSSMAGDYDGTYSAQRQELVEAYDGYRMMTATFVARFVRPVWESFVRMAIASGRVRVPAEVNPETVAQAMFRGPKMPWIDPQREARGMRELCELGVESRTAIIAERGGRVQDKFEEIARERKLAGELGIPLDAGNAAAAPPAEGDDQNTEDNDQRRREERQARMRLVRTTGDLS